jgi:group II intron reverse transcriptase/maturase
METKLARIAEVAKAKPKERFTSLAHLLNKQMLWDCHLELPANKATGVDQVTKAAYEANLEANLDDLVARLKRKGYRPQASRRTHIPKDEKSKRPLGIPAYEDKIVQRGMNKILQAIYEQDFLPFSYGFRPGRGQHDALRALDRIIMRNPVHYVVDADIRGFFNHVDHEWLMRFLKERIADPNILLYIQRFLKAGIMENGVYEKTDEGTPQGGLISPLLGNVYLHYALDLWFEIAVKRGCRGYAGMVRFADDFVCCFEYKEDAECFYAALIGRLKKFKLEIAEEKTKIIRFGRGAETACKHLGRKKPQTFDFLGFTHYWGKGKSGKYRLKRKTSAKKFKMRVKEFKQWIRTNRHMPEQELVTAVRRKLAGHYNYYGISDNYRCIRQYYNMVLGLIRKWRNRRSQKKSLTWEKFQFFLERNPLPTPTIRVNLFASSNAVNGGVRSRMR